MPNKYEALCEEFAGTGIRVMKDGHLVSRQSDWILYSVPAEFIDSVVATYGPCKSAQSVVSLLLIKHLIHFPGQCITDTPSTQHVNSDENWSDCGGSDIG